MCGEKRESTEVWSVSYVDWYTESSAQSGNLVAYNGL